MRAPFVVVASLVAVLTCTVFVSRASAQATTGTLRGTITSADDGQPLIEAEVTLVHEPSGNEKTTTTNSDGAFVFTGLRVGGPYHVTATFTGFKPTEEKGIVLTATKTVDISIALKLDAEVIEVSGTSVPRNTSGRQVVTAAEIEALPSIDRDPRDMVRRTPEVNVTGAAHVMSVGGMNPRFNSITIDGLRMDDDFGLNASGYPTRRSPIPLSAIEELDVEQSPFDVRYSKFLGGNVNIITKSGTNDLHGSLFGTFSSDALLGHTTGNITVPDTQFHEYRYGAEIAGPILQDKIHFLFAIEGLSASTPTSVGPLGSNAANITTKVTQDDVAMAQQIASQVYGFNAGDPSRSLDEGNLNLSAKVDYAVDNKNRITVNFLRNSGNQIQEAFSTAAILPLTSNWYNAVDTLNSGSVRWFSDITDTLSTELSVSGKRVSSRVPPLEGNGFMAATILTSSGGQILLGPDDFRHTNELDNDLLQVRGVANYLVGNHLITGGLEYELLRVHNLFIQDTNGAAQYASLTDFMNRNPSQIFFETATTLNPADAAANFKTGTLSPFIQDQFKITPELILTGGVRVEIYKADTNIVENPVFVDRYGFSNTSTLDGRSLLEPRLGLSYLATDKLNLRAGGGLYSGGTPSVWVSNAYTNDGVRIGTAFDNNPADISGFDGRNIPSAVAAMVKPGNGNVDALDPHFKLPSAWKAGTGADWELPYAATLKLNYVYTKVREGVNWVDLRRCDSPSSTQTVCTSIPNSAPLGLLPDGRYYYDTAMFPTHIGYDMELTNDNRGYGHTASAMLSKGFGFGLFVAGAYAYQHVMDVNPANSSRSVSNYDNLAVFDPNQPDLARSSYEITHRFTLSVEYSHSIVGDFVDSGPWKYMKTSFGMFADAHSGQPFSWTFGDSTAGGSLSKLYGEDQSIARVNRMLFYVPKGDGSDVILQGIDPADFEAFLQQTGLAKYRGQVAPANVFTSSWVSRIDVRLAQDLPNPLGPGHRAKVVLDIQNLGNLLDKKWGRTTTVPFPYNSIAVDVARDPVSGKYIYSNLRPPDQSVISVLASVWKASIGLMYDF